MNVWSTDNRTAEERQKSLRESLIQQGYSPAQADALIAQLGGSQQATTTDSQQTTLLVLAVAALVLWPMLKGGEDDEE